MRELPEIRTAIAGRLLAARRHSGLSQGQVAKLLGLHRPAISEIESGKRRVSAEELTRLAEIYGVSPNWLTAAQDAGPDPSVELAARDLQRLAPEDLDIVLQLVQTIRRDRQQ